jgi:hypothetical protein
LGQGNYVTKPTNTNFICHTHEMKLKVNYQQGIHTEAILAISLTTTTNPAKRAPNLTHSSSSLIGLAAEAIISSSQNAPPSLFPPPSH